MESVVQEFSMACRGCLNSTRELKNLFDFGLAEDFNKMTDLKVSQTDNLSQLLCIECVEYINNYRSFRKQCRQTDFLLNMVINKHDTSNLRSETKQNTLAYSIKDNTLFIKITAPNVDEPIIYKCPQKCKENFKKKTDLSLHMKRHHDPEMNTKIQYYCIENNCSYNLNSNTDKFFTERKYLNQHINKVHTIKNICQSCEINFSNNTDYENHIKTCNNVHTCQVCNKDYKTKDRLLVHLMRKHPDFYKNYKLGRRAEKRKIISEKEKIGTEKCICDSPKRTFATQTLINCHIMNDVVLSSWLKDETRKDEISTQTAFDELFSMKSQNSDEFNLYTDSVSDIQTQTVPLEFGLSRSNKETITSETQSPDLSIKETQTCFCLFDTCKPKDTEIVNPFCMTSTQTQTFVENDLLSVSSAETQTCFEEMDKDF